MMTTTTRTKKRVIAKRLQAALAFFLVASALLTFAPARLAANPSGSAAEQTTKDYALIFGTVWDKDGHPVYGIKVKMRRSDHKKAQWEFVSDHHGEFAQRVPVGTADYVIWADTKVPKGSKPVETKVHIENNERVDVGLHLTE
jgi:hypothetical protein